MSTNIEFGQYLFEKVGSTISKSEARELGIEKKLFRDSDLDHDGEIDVDDEVLEIPEGEMYAVLQNMFEEEQAAAAEDEEEIPPAQGTSGGTGA